MSALGRGGADGIVFAIAPSSTSLGGNGGGIGYSGIANSVGVEFDDWRNRRDPNSNHIGINRDGSTASIVARTAPANLENGNVWTAWVDYDAATNTLEVRASDTGIRSEDPWISAEVDILQVVGQSDAYFGFTSGTGLAYGDFDIYSWTLTTDVPGGPLVVDAGPDQTVPEGSVVQLSVANRPEADLSWEVVTASGPPVLLLGADTATSSFLAPDDGVYTLRVTAIRGEESVFDDVVVSVVNVAPVVSADAAPTATDGLVMVAAPVTDAGILDTHQATINWGDGSPATTVDASAQGVGSR